MLLSLHPDNDYYIMATKQKNILSRAFLEGMMSINPFGKAADFGFLYSPENSLAQDWKNVGNDIRHTMISFSYK